MRSLLFVPGDRPERFDKACACGADAVVIDLEDAVSPEAKDIARTALAKWLTPDRRVLVRVNGVNTRWHDDDMALARLPGVLGIVLPKAERPSEVRAAAAASLSGVVLPLIESARGMRCAEAIAAAPGVSRLIFGSIDFQSDLGIHGDDQELLLFRSQLVLASRLAGVASPVDGVSVTLDDVHRLRLDAQRARSLGFGGKLCIHPKQVEVVNAAFSPSPAELAWARHVLVAAAQAGGAAVKVNGQMVDRPVVLRAEAVLERAGKSPGGGDGVLA